MRLRLIAAFNVMDIGRVSDSAEDADNSNDNQHLDQRKPLKFSDRRIHDFIYLFVGYIRLQHNYRIFVFSPCFGSDAINGTVVGRIGA